MHLLRAEGQEGVKDGFQGRDNRHRGIEGSGGSLEIRTDAPTSFSTHSVGEVDLNSTSLTLFVDRAVSGSSLC